MNLRFLTKPGYWLKFLGVFAVYFLAARFGLGLGAVSGFATLVWPPTGIALAAVLLFDYKIWPAIALGAFFVNWITGAPPIAATGIALGNTLEAVVGTMLLRKVWGDFRPSLDRLRDAFGLLLFAGVSATLVSATIGVTSLLLAGVVTEEKYVETWTAWWIGDVLGVFVVAPLLLVWSRLRSSKPKIRAVLEIIVLASLIIGINLIVFGAMTSPAQNNALNYLIFIPVIWAAVRFRQRGATLAIAFTSALAIYATTIGQGPFVTSTLSQSLLYLQVFTAVVASTGLVLAAAVTESKLSAERAEKLNEELKKSVHKKTLALERAQSLSHVGTWEWNIANDQFALSNEALTILGMKQKNTESTLDGFLRRIDPAFRDEVDLAIKRMFASDENYFGEFKVRANGKEPRWVAAEIGVVKNKKGDAIEIYGIIQDISETKKIIDELTLTKNELEKMNQIIIKRELDMVAMKQELNNLRNRQ